MSAEVENVQPRANHARVEGPNWTLHHGRWQDVLPTTHCDALITDPPYSARTHAAETTRSDGVDAAGLTPDYAPWTPDDVHEFVRAWSPRVSGWMACMTDDMLIDAYRAAYRDVGRYDFQPLPCCIGGMSHRMQADGPSSEVVYVMVSRPRLKTFVDLKWNSRGFYEGDSVCEDGGEGLPTLWYRGNAVRYGRRGGTPSGRGRGKPDWLEHALVRDFSRPSDVVCDPLAGFGGVLVAAQALGRSAIGSEMDSAAYQEAVRRLQRPLQVDLLAGLGT